MLQATGTFTVSMNPRALSEDHDGKGLDALSFDKEFTGELAGTSIGEMIAHTTATEGSAGYVALEVVTGTVPGAAESGGFVLQHSGTMQRGDAGLSLTVVPDSGHGGLVGISGSMTIDIVEGVHHYVFSYEFE